MKLINYFLPLISIHLINMELTAAVFSAIKENSIKIQIYELNNEKTLQKLYLLISNK